MLPNVISLCRRASYSCLLSPWTRRFRLQPAALVVSSSNPAKLFHGSINLAILDRDEKRRVSKLTEHKTPQDDGPSEEMEVKIEGMLASGIPTPSSDTYSMIIDGTRYDELPILHVFSTRNNTIISLTDYNGKAMTSSSAGAEGFRNAKKGTNIAGQAVGISVGEKTVNKGIKYVRVCAKGFGPGRLSAIKGLQMGGVKIVSITDTTPTPYGKPRPKKQRRL